ncbi:hypothetical protein F8M41_020361 [Gigaspora margarita]|uniref:Uncharacterized protein n=2 Tax=Gigaspora margarita TaxID=4874 RepID=A0A8H4AIK9_GIGMA|nr:hypothetical protein F8M41_020361 [Gigaspora margarita]
MNKSTDFYENLSSLANKNCLGTAGLAIPDPNLKAASSSLAKSSYLAKITIKGQTQTTETSFEISKNLQEILEEAINDVNKYPEKLNLAEVKIYRQKIVTQLEYFKDFDKKALKFEDFDDMINLAYDILFKSANLKSTCQSEMNSLVSEIDKYLPEWINSCTEITNKFNQFYEDLNDFITSNNIGDNLLTFKIQEELLTKIDEIKTDLHKSDKWNKIYLNKEKTRSNFLLIIGLKSVYDLTTELEYARSGFKLLDPLFIKEISDFWKELIHELRSSEELVKIFKENELYVKESCFDFIVENLVKIGFCLFKFFRNIVVKKVAKK